MSILEIGQSQLDSDLTKVLNDYFDKLSDATGVDVNYIRYTSVGDELVWETIEHQSDEEVNVSSTDELMKEQEKANIFLSETKKTQGSIGKAINEIFDKFKSSTDTSIEGVDINKIDGVWKAKIYQRGYSIR